MNNQAHPLRVAFGNLYQACYKRKLFARLHNFEEGQTVHIMYSDGKSLLRITRYHGDAEEATAAAAAWLIANGYLDFADLEG